MTEGPVNIYRTRLSKADFDKLSNYIQNNIGIKMPESKKMLLEGRLHKRLAVLNMTSFEQYLSFVFSSKGSTELINLIDVVTTNKTDFFREPIHFDYLTNVVLPEFKSKQFKRPFKVWSAGCSTGEEPYTISIVLQEFKNNNPDFDYQIWASDLSTRVLQKAASGVYHIDRIVGMPTSLKQKYFLKSKDATRKEVRVVPELRSKVNFFRLNFMDDSYAMSEFFDVVFCRNVLIYFDRETQEAVINKLCQRIKPGNYFFLGHSESITNINVPLSTIKPTIFKRI